MIQGARNGDVVVTFAKQDARLEDDVAGRGHGFVDVFTNNGAFVRRLVTRGALDSPWGLALAPRGFGRFPPRDVVGRTAQSRPQVNTCVGVTSTMTESAVESAASNARRAARKTATLCYYPGCKNVAAPRFGMFCASVHKNLPAAEKKKYREKHLAKTAS